MSENVAVMDEISDVHAAEVHANLDSRIWSRGSVKWHLDHVEVLPLIHGHRGPGCSARAPGNGSDALEFMIFQCLVLKCPILYRTLMGDDGGRIKALNDVGVRPSTLIKKFVGLAGSVGSESTSEKYRVRCTAGFAVASPTNR